MLFATRKLKCVLVGDDAVGKTCMLRTYTDGAYAPNVISDSICMETFVDGQPVLLDLWDTARSDNPERPRSYPDTSVFLLVYSIVSPRSFDSVKMKWWPELQRTHPGVPVILVGNKSDLRTDQITHGNKSELRTDQITHGNKSDLRTDQITHGNKSDLRTDQITQTAGGNSVITQADAQERGKEIGAVKVMECSASTGEGLKNVFVEAVRACRVVSSHPKKKKLIRAFDEAVTSSTVPTPLRKDRNRSGCVLL